MTLVISLLLLVFSLWELLHTGQKILKLGWSGWINTVMLLFARYRRPVDVSQQLLPPPPAAQKNIETLGALGFRRLGEAQVKHPFRPPITVWVFVQLERRIPAEVAGRRVEFATYFQEKTLLVTDFPNGEHIEIPSYQSHTIVTSLAKAYEYHVQQIAKFSRTYGSFHPIHSMTDYLRWEQVGRANYGMRKLMRWVGPNLVRLGAFIYGLLVLVLIPLFFDPKVLSFIPQINLLSPQELKMDVIILLLLPAIALSRFANRRAVRQTHKDSRSLGSEQGY
jgi:hypothetical protein